MSENGECESVRERSGDYLDEEHEAAAHWTRLAEGEDVAATRFVETYGYVEALDRVREAARRSSPPSGDLGRWAARYNPEAARAELERGMRLGGLLIRGDEAWPQSLGDLGETSPRALWYQGEPTCLSEPLVAIVGSRAASTYGLTIATDFAYDLGRVGVGTISGGALGIDAAAHRGALASAARTVAVMAGGVDRPYPVANSGLFGDILRAGGLLCSEQPPGAICHRHRFLARNRLIAALAQVCIVVEAPYRSGALSTAHHALTIGRDVGAVPGAITSPNSAGSHRLLREGAICVSESAHVAELVREVSMLQLTQLTRASTLSDIDRERGSTGASRVVERGNIRARGIASSGLATADVKDVAARRLAEALSTRKPASLEVLAARVGMDVRCANAAIGLLELHGIAERSRGGWVLARREEESR